MLVEKVEEKTTEAAVRQKATKTYSEAQNALMKDSSLKAVFSSSCNNVNARLKNTLQDEIYDELVTRTLNCMMNARIMIINETHKNRAGQTKLREGLKLKLKNKGAERKRQAKLTKSSVVNSLDMNDV